MITFPNAKINIGLNIVERRQDGYHNIETVFYPIQLCDALEVVPPTGDRYQMFTDGIDVKTDIENNLITKAFRLLEREFNLSPIDVHFLKKIPFGAGLGGGSADAAFMLKMLNEYFELKLTNTQLEEYAAKLGADCSFFIKNQPVFAQGIGNVFTSINFSLKGYYIVLIKPDIHVSTPEAYAGVEPQRPEVSLLQFITQNSIEAWKDVVVNDFEKSVFSKYPTIRKIKESLYADGAVYASMSGSGSSVFGIFKTQPTYLEQYAEHFVWCGLLN